MNKIVYTTESRPARVRYRPSPKNERTCASCGTEQVVRNRSYKIGFGMVAFLDCGHFQNDDEY